MPRNIALKSRILDEKDRKILTILQKNARASLTSIAKQVGLSIDSINNRIKAMHKKEVFQWGIFIEPRKIGFPLVADIKIKLRNITEQDKQEFIAHLQAHPRVIDLLSLMGDFDFTCVIIAKSTSDLDTISTAIRQKFSHLIADWKGMLILQTHKFEEYDLREEYVSL